jgi:hypothetical protein
MLTPPCSRNDDATAIYVDDDTRIQILDSMPDLPRADKEQCGAFIVSFESPLIRPGPKTHVVSPRKRDERVLVVWSDNLEGIIPLCRDFDDNLIKLVWSRRHSLTSLVPGPSLAPTPGATSATNSASDVDIDEKRQEIEVATPEPEPNAKPISGGSLWGWRIGSKAKRAPALRDLERGGASVRPTRYFAPVYGGLGLALSTCKLFKILDIHLLY